MLKTNLALMNHNARISKWAVNIQRTFLIQAECGVNGIALPNTQLGRLFAMPEGFEQGND